MKGGGGGVSWVNAEYKHVVHFPVFEVSPYLKNIGSPPEKIERGGGAFLSIMTPNLDPPMPIRLYFFFERLFVQRLFSIVHICTNIAAMDMNLKSLSDA